jgi:hypothetical protein
MLNDDFRFTELTGATEDEVLNLKNDVLKLVENMDKLKQDIINLNAKVKIQHREDMLIIEDLIKKVEI